MKTTELIDILARGAEPVPAHPVARRYVAALALGAVASAVLMVTWLGVRPDLAEAAGLPMFWIKSLFVALMAAASVVSAVRLSRPGARLTGVPIALAAPVIAIWLLAVTALSGATAAERTALFWGGTWNICPVYIALLSVPVFIGALWAMKGLAPTRLRLAGAAAGLLAGSLSANVYALHCTEMGAPFLGTWYVIGMLIPAAVGAAIGPRVLRW
jgi:hypothetical protein